MPDRDVSDRGVSDREISDREISDRDAPPSGGAIAIAIDGPAASGKGTVARAVAHALGYRYLDTGAMYRAVAVAAAEAGIPLGEEDAVAALADRLSIEFRYDGGRPRIIVDGRDRSADIRTQEAGEGASAVAVHPAVRRSMVARQRAMAAAGGVVLDGRDIGTVVLPDAALKIYLDASLEERARRRWAELRARGVQVDLAEVLDELRRRDRQDSSRAVGPLRRADDAVVVDTTNLIPAEVVAEILALARQRGARPDRGLDAAVPPA